MKKNVLKVFAACAAACFVSGLVFVCGGADTAKADDGVICDYNFDSDDLSGLMQKGTTKYTIEEGRNSSLIEGDTSKNCLKVERGNENDWWERTGFKFDLKKLTPGKQYVVTIDFAHDSEPATVTKDGKTYEFDDMRAFKIGTYFDGGYEEGSLQGTDEEKNEFRANNTAKYGQIGGLAGTWNGNWERITGMITIKEDVLKSDKEYYLHLFMGYPEAVGSSGAGYKCDSVTKEAYYVDNFSIKEYVEPAPQPATPTPAPVVTATPAPAVTPQPPVANPPIVDEGLEVGYEDVVKGITYKVTGKDTVAAVGFDKPKASLSIPATITLEGFTYKVTAIDAKAFKGDSIKTLTIGNNVQTIGKSAFQGCTSLKKITIKSTVIKSIGKAAFKKTSAKATVKVPKSKKKAYQKLLKKAGLSKKAKVK